MASNVLCNYWFISLLILIVYTSGIASSDYEHETNVHKRALGVGNWEQSALPKARRWFPPCTRWGCNGKRDEATDSYRRFKSTILPLQRALDKADTLTSYRMRLAKTNKIE
ncbi:hypothetical protein ABFA07_011979 [Porites harrisoni]